MPYQKESQKAIFIGAGIVILAVVALFVFAPNESSQPQEAGANLKLEESLGISTIVLNDFPAVVEPDSSFGISWKVNTDPQTINHTAVFWDIESHPGEFTLDTTPDKVGYQFITQEFASGEFVVPRDFYSRLSVPVDAEQIFFRVHAIINGAHYWSSEQVVAVVTPSDELDEEGEQALEQNIESSEDELAEAKESVVINYTDNGFDPTEVVVSAGESVLFVNNSSRSFWPASDDHLTHRVYPGSDISNCNTPLAVEMFDACDPLSPGSEYEFIFYQIGEWGYHDHLRASLTGRVVVH